MGNIFKITKKTILLILVTMLLLFSFSLTVFADDTIKVNNLDAKKGDTITYVVRMSGAKEKISALDLRVSYDTESLEIDKDTLNIPYAKSPICNADTPGKIVFNAIEGIEGMDFSEEQILFSVSFKVKDNAQDCTITHEMKQILNAAEEMKDIHEIYEPDDYTLSTEVIEGLWSEEIIVPGNGSEYLAELEGEKVLDTAAIVIIVIAVVLVVLVAAVVINNTVKKKKNGSTEL